MRLSADRCAAVTIALSVLTISCASGGPGSAPSLPGETAGEATAGLQAAAPRRSGHVPADVQFMERMIVHHMQAVAMTKLAHTRAGENIRVLARRIERSQEDEMTRMRNWLRARGHAVPDEHALHAGSHADMPGMASDEELARLTALSGAPFDRLFLELMIRHHEGALTMVQQLFATPGAGADPELYQFASHIDADQRMEIARMRRMLQ